MAIVSPNASDQLDAALAIAQTFPITKITGTLKGNGTFQSLFKATGLPLAGNQPTGGTGAVCNRSTAGGLPLAAFGTKTGYVAKLSAVGSAAMTIFLADRLLHVGGLNGNIATLQTINSPNISRNLTTPNLLFVEIYTATGATAAVLTVNYTNLASQAKTATVNLVTSPVTGQMQWIALTDTGVLSIQSCQLSVATGTVGDFGLTVLNQIETLAIATANVGSRLGVYDMAIPTVDPEACLFFFILATGTTAVLINGNISIAQG